jgi:DNA-binding CsgD family transcriptional regulator/PAS domain-containing protein
VHDVTLRGSWAQAGGGWEPDLFAAYNQHFVAVNPWIPGLGKRPIGQVVPAEFMLPRADLMKTEFYQDFLTRAKLDSGVGVTVQQDGTRYLIVSVLFPHSLAERDPDTIDRLQRLAPHLQRVAQLNRQFAGIETRAVAAEAALQHLATALLIVDAAGRVAYHSQAAASVIAAADGLIIVSNRLAAIDPGETQALRQLVVAAVQAPREVTAAPGGVIRIRRQSARPDYQVLVAPLGETMFASGLSEPMAAVFIRDPDMPATTPTEWLQRLHGLTPAEARVMQALLNGDPLKRMAEHFHVGTETLRTQLKAIYRKTDTCNQAELIHLGLRGLATFQRWPITQKSAGIPRPGDASISTHC